MKRRMRSKREPGQSIVLIALILAVLIGLVALSVDVGNAYAQQRAAQRAANSAALDAMRTFINKGTQSEIFRSIQTTLDAHHIPYDPNQFNKAGVNAASGTRSVDAYYIREDTSSLPVRITDTAPPPSDTRYIQVKIGGSERTTFATLFGQDELNVRADAYSHRALCKPMPIGIASTAFSNFGTEPTDRLYSDSSLGLQDKQMRRLFLRDNPPPFAGSRGDQLSGQFTWLRWKEDYNGSSPAQYMATAITGDGTADQYGEVAPWPFADTNGKPDPIYPVEPGKVTATDVIYGGPVMSLGGKFGTGDKFDGPPASNAEFVSQIQWHITNRTVMNLPLYDKMMPTQTGADGRYQMSAEASYMIAGYGYDSNPASFRGSGWYLDVVYIDKAQDCPNLEAPSGQFASVKLAGSLQIKPVYELGLSNARPPIDLVLVLDASGSMNWNWDGYGTMGATTATENVLTQFQPAGARGAGYPINCAQEEVLILPKGCQSGDAWANYQERRLFKAKQAIKGFLDQFNFIPTDRATLITYNGQYFPPDPNAPVGITPPTTAMGRVTARYPTGGLTTNIRNGAGSLVDLLVNQAATKSPGSADLNALYTTLGASPGALGLLHAHQTFETAPPAPGNRERVVVFFTDGLLNVGLDALKTPRETFADNVGDGKPIFQALEEATSIKTDSNTKAKIFVIAMGPNFRSAYLDEMATGTDEPYFQVAANADVLPALLTNIGEQVLNGDCDPQELDAQVPDRNRVVIPETTPPQPGPAIGQVIVSDASGNEIRRVNVRDNGEWLVPDLQVNTAYNLSFKVENYLGDDNIARPYNMILFKGNERWTHNTGTKEESMTVFIDQVMLRDTLALEDPVELHVPDIWEPCPPTS